MAMVSARRRSAEPRDDERRPARPRSALRRPTTILAALVLAAAATTATVLHTRDDTSTGPVAATVGATPVTASAVQREVAAIESQPAYLGALNQASTPALAAPVDPKALAAAGGDPDDLRVTLVPVGGKSTSRGYTTEDLQASVLTRLLYVTVMEQILAAHHVPVTASELVDGREEAVVESGQDASGHSLFGRLPVWYQDELARRGADVEALEQSLVGEGGITPAAVHAAYRQRRLDDFTTVCLRAAVVPAASASRARSELAAGGSGGQDEGCAPMGDWTAQVIGAVEHVGVGHLSGSLHRGDRVAVLKVTARTVEPYSAVAGDVRAELGSRYTDDVNAVVEDQLALDRVTVAPEYGTYENLGAVHGVLPPDALTPPTKTTTPAKPARAPRQRLDPFD
jgi:hypothetical protein